MPCGDAAQAIVYILSSFGCAKAPKRIALRLVRIIPVWHRKRTSPVGADVARRPKRKAEGAHGAMIKREDKKKDGQRPSCHLCAVLPFVPPLFVSDHSETVHRTREARLRGIKLHAALFV